MVNLMVSPSIILSPPIYLKYQVDGLWVYTPVYTPVQLLRHKGNTLLPYIYTCTYACTHMYIL